MSPTYDDLTDKQREIVDVMMEGRVTPEYLSKQTSIDAKQTVQYHIRNLRAERVVRKVDTGLYELEAGFERGDHAREDG